MGLHTNKKMASLLSSLLWCEWIHKKINKGKVDSKSVLAFNWLITADLNYFRQLFHSNKANLIYENWKRSQKVWYSFSFLAFYWLVGRSRIIPLSCLIVDGLYECVWFLKRIIFYRKCKCVCLPFFTKNVCNSCFVQFYQLILFSRTYS